MKTLKIHKYYFQILSLIVGTILLFSNLVFSQIWSHNNYRGGHWGGGIYINPANPDSVLIFSSSVPNWSDDGGYHLTPTTIFEGFAGGTIYNIGPNYDSLYVFGSVENEKTLLFSDDRGSTFENRTPTDSDFRYWKIFCSNQNGKKIAAPATEGFVFSTDAGENWNHVEEVDNQDNIKEVHFHPVHDSIMYAIPITPRLYRTNDFGETWVSVDSFVTNNMHVHSHLYIDPLNPDIMFAAMQSIIIGGDILGIGKSLDGGITWELIDFPGNIFGYGPNDELLVATRDNLYYSTDGFETMPSYFAEGGGLPGAGLNAYWNPRIIQVVPQNHDIIFVEQCGSLFRTEDRGISWDEIGEGANNLRISGVAKHPLSNDILIGLGVPNNSWKISNSYTTSNIWSMSRVSRIQFQPENSSTILRASFHTGFTIVYPSSKPEIEISNDGGEEWQDVTGDLFTQFSPLVLMDACMYPSNPDLLFATLYASRWEYASQPLYKSTNGGENWDVVPGFEDEYGGYFRDDPSNPERLYFQAAYTDKLYRMDSQYQSFQLVNNDCAGFLLVHPVQGDILEVFSDALFVSTDLGESFTRLNIPSDGIRSAIYHPFDPFSILILVNGPVIYFTEDLGENWIEIECPEEYSPGYLSSILIDDLGNIVAADNVRGLWVGENLIPMNVTNNGSALTTTFELLPPYPNPFNSTIQIPFTISQTGTIEIGIYDVLGREIDVINRNIQSSGIHQINWNTEKLNISSGSYFVRLKSNGSMAEKKITFIK